MSTRIFLLSDTHSWLDPGIASLAAECDEIWHAGDIGTISIMDELAKIRPVKAVYGNIDGTEIRKEFPESLFFEMNGVKVWMIHIGGYPGKYAPSIREKIIQIKPDLFICGHSHILKAMYDKKNKLLHLNPGAAGRYGWHQIRTAMRFTLNNGRVENLEVIELGKKG